MMVTFMKIDEYLFRFPRYIPNDIEGFMFTYPKKFPPIVAYFEGVAKKIGADSKAYQEYGDWAHEELFKGFKKIKKDYDNGDQTNLEFLVDIDQRFNKLFCYRFWVVNYLFADGPLHDFYVDTLKNLIRKFIDVTDEIEDFENRVIRIQRDLLQGDYADLYLRQALSGVGLVKLLIENPKTQVLMSKVQNIIDKHNLQDANAINKIWDKVVAVVEDKSDPQSASLREKLAIPIEQAKMRKSMLPMYNMLTHAVEFRSENETLTGRNEEMVARIESLKSQAKEKLTQEEFDLFILSYEQARNFAMYKDIMGEMDGPLLPVWFGLHDQVRKIISPNIPLARTGHASMFYQLVWFLPMNLKDKVFTVDNTPFDLKTL